MKRMYYVIADTHFGHKGIMDWAGRPDDYVEKIFTNIVRVVKEDDILIHLGDVAFGEEDYYHRLLRKAVKSKMWLVRGNHDKRGDGWYLDRGWDFIGSSIVLRWYGERIVLSHKPVSVEESTYNVHGHFHNNAKSKWEPELVAVMKEGTHKLIKCEHTYAPQNLEKVIKKKG